MTPEQLYKDACEAKAQGSVCGMFLVFNRKGRKPKGFPRGDLLSETEHGSVYSFNPDKVIVWLIKNGFVPKVQDD